MFSAGICMFAFTRVEFDAWTETISAVTGEETTLQDLDKVGARVAAMRTSFGLREGVSPVNYHYTGRAYGTPPAEIGPLAGIVVDVDTLRREYFEARGWDPDTAVPRRDTLELLDLQDVAEDFHGATAPARS
jgi:aldehyde:ferredoxin oxidoreductase